MITFVISKLIARNGTSSNGAESKRRFMRGKMDSYIQFSIEESGIFHTEFTFGNINSTGLLDFQFLSWEHEKVKIGKPRFWAQTKITPLGPGPNSFMELCDYSALISAGSEWCSVNGTLTGNPTDFAFVNQGVELLMNLSKGGYSIIQKLKLDTLIGRVVMDPRQSDYIDIGILFNLTAVIYTTLMMKAIRVPLSMILEIGMYGLK